MMTHDFISCQEKCGSSGWHGGNPAMQQVDRLTSCASPQFFFNPLQCQGQDRARAGNPHLHPATSSLPLATQEQCVLCAAA